MRSVLFGVRRRVRRDHSDDNGRAHESFADVARVRLQRPRSLLHLLHRVIAQRPASSGIKRLQSSHRLFPSRSR